MTRFSRAAGARWFRPAAATVVVLAIVVGVVVVRDSGRREPVVLPEPIGFAILPGGDEVPRLMPVTVTFESAPKERAPEKLLELSPQTKGTYTWLSERTVLFQPDFPGLLRGMTYTVTVPANPAAGVAQAATKTFTVAGRLAVQQVIPGDGDTEVPLAAQILVQFNRSVAPLTMLAAQRTDPVIAFEPTLGGKGEWLNTSIYRFVPSDLAPTTTYRLRLAKGLSSATDGVLADDYRWSFTTVTPGVAVISPDDNTEFAGPRQPVTITFNQPMDRSAGGGIALRDLAGPAIPGRVTWNDDATAATFTPSATLSRSTKYIVSVEKGLRGARGGETSVVRTSAFTTVGLPSVASTRPANGEQGADRYSVTIQFATPMDPDTLEGKVSVSGFAQEEVDRSSYRYERAVGVNLALKPSTAYTVALAPGATDRYGQAMGGYRFSFTTGALQPSVNLALPGYQPTATFSSAAQPFVYFQAVNTPNVTFTLWPLTPNEAHALLGSPNAAADRNFKPSLEPLRKWSETVEGPKDSVAVARTSLSLDGHSPLPKGYYFARTDGQYLSQVAFAVVDTVLVTKLSQDELLVWALDHQSGAAIAGLTLHAEGFGLAPSDARTDSSGLASFKVPPPLQNTSGDRAYYMTGDGGGRLGVMSTRWSPGVSPYQFGLPGEYYAREWVGQVYTDRPIYRPGETVDYKVIVRADDDARYSVPAADVPLELVLRNARYQEVQRQDLKLNAFGTVAGTFAIPADAPLGDYSINVQRTGNQYTVTGNSFLVAEFRKPEFQVDLTAKRPSVVDGDRLEVDTTASFFFGGPLAGGKVDWSVVAEPYALRAKGFDFYSFVDYDFSRTAVSRDATRAKGTTTTDDRGVARISATAALNPSEGAQTYVVSATVTDQNAQAVAGSTKVVVHPAELYAGIRPTQYVATVGRDAQLDLATVDTEGNPLPGRTVTVKVYDRQWITTKEAVPGGGRRYASVAKDELLQTLTARSGSDGKASVSFVPTKPGTIRAVAEVSDARGHTARASAYLWISAAGLTGGFALWQVTNDDTIKLVADKDRYEVGDTAEVLVPAPFAGATGLVTVERGKLITRDVRRFETNSERLHIPITDRSVPNVFVGVVLYRPPTAEDPIPRYKVGYVELVVSTSTRVLNVSVKPDRAQTTPGDTVRYDIKVTNKDGKGARAEVSVAVIDKAVLSLLDERGPDGLHAFWFERGLAVNTSSSMAVSVDRYNDTIAIGFGGAGTNKGGSGLVAGQARKDFRNTAFWVPSVVTKDDGTASVEVKIPDNLTTWRTQVRAISGDTMVGEGLNELVSTQPLLIRPALPRFLRVGDAAELRTLVRNATTASSDVTVTLKAEGVTVSGPLAQTVKIAAGESALVSWPSKTEAEGTATIGFSATGTGGLSDSVELQIPTVLDVTPETMSTGGVVSTEGKSEALYLPGFVNTKHGSLEVAVRSALVGSMSGELSLLAPFSGEGAEHVASRLIATLAVRRAEKSAGAAPSVRDDRIASDLANLIGRQRPDGGWAWCDPWCVSDPNVTGWALLALGEARRDGLAVDPNVLSRATGYVFTEVNRTADAAHPIDPSFKAFLLAALAAAGEGDRAATPARALFEQYRSQLTSWGRAYLALALTDSKVSADDPQVRALFNDLTAATIPNANGNHWEDQNGASFMTSTGTTAIATMAIGRVQTDHALLPQTVRWLVLGRTAEYWHSSIDRALGILALTGYAAKTGELGGDYSYKLLLDDKDVLAGLVKPGSTPTTAEKTVPISALKPGATSILEFQRDYDRPGRLYYTLNFKYVTPAKEIEALNRGFAISRSYSLLDTPDRPITGAKLGDTVRVTMTVIVNTDHNFVAVEDLLPAGLEAVDARLKNVDPALKLKLAAERLGSLERKAGGYLAPWFGWYYSPWQQVDLRDDRAVLYADHLPKGVYEYVYYARATTPGDFFIAPAHAEETYFPEVFGRSDSGRFAVAP